jgi:hypothetical protein
MKFTNNLVALAVVAIFSQSTFAAPLPGRSGSGAQEQQSMHLQAQQMSMQMHAQTAQSIARFRGHSVASKWGLPGSSVAQNGF